MSNLATLASGSQKSFKSKHETRIKRSLCASIAAVTATTLMNAHFIFVYGTDDTVVVKNDDVSVFGVKGDMSHRRRSIDPLRGQMRGQLSGKRRVLRVNDIVLDDLEHYARGHVNKWHSLNTKRPRYLVIGVSNDQQPGIGMERQRRRVALVSRQD